MHRGYFVWTPTPPLSGPRTPGPGPARVCVCMPLFAGSGRLSSRARFGASHLFLWLGSLHSLLAPPPPGLGFPLFVVVAVFFLFFSHRAAPLSLAFGVFRPGVPWALASCCPPARRPPLFFVLLPFPPPLSSFFACLFLVFVFFFLPWCAACALRGWFVCLGLWGVVVCVAVGVVPRQGPDCACAKSFSALWLFLFSVCCCLLCCAWPVAPCWRRSSSPCCLWCPAWVLCSLVLFCGACGPSLPLGAVLGLACCTRSCSAVPLVCVVWSLRYGVLPRCEVPCGVVRSPPSSPRVLCAVFCFCFIWVCGRCAAPPPPGWFWCPVLCVVVRHDVWCCGLWCVVCFARCCVVCLRFAGFLTLAFWRAFVLGLVVFCCRVLFCSLLVLLLWAPCFSWRLLCGAVLACLRCCSLCGAQLPLWRWLVLCVVACCIWWFAVWPGCPLWSPGGPWCRFPVVLSLSARVARRPVVWCGVSWCSAALCCVLSSCVVVWWCAVVLCCLFASLPVPVVCSLLLRVLLCVFLGVALCIPCPLRSVQCCAALCWCPCVVLFAWSALFLVPGAVCSWCRCLFLGVCWWLWLPGVVFGWCVSALVSVSSRVARQSASWCGTLWCPTPLWCVLWCCASVWCCAVVACRLFLPPWWR